MATVPEDVGTDLAQGFALVTRHLHSGANEQSAGLALVRAALVVVPGCDHAAISTVRRSGSVTTDVASDDLPRQVDALQYELREGPCLDAIHDDLPVRSDDIGADTRWPRFGPRAARETGVASMMAFRLHVEDDVLGALNLYSRTPAAFDVHARSVSSILAVHGAVAMMAGREHEHVFQLDAALRSSRTIGTAIGIVMAVHGIGDDEAFDVLKRSSQNRNVKLRDLAAEVVEGRRPPR